MCGNSYGVFMTTIHDDQRAFDLLPPPLRWAVNYAVHPYASEKIIAEFRDAAAAYGRRNACAILVKSIRAQDRRGTVKAYGPNHPEASHD